MKLFDKQGCSTIQIGGIKADDRSNGGKTILSTK